MHMQHCHHWWPLLNVWHWSPLKAISVSATRLDSCKWNGPITVLADIYYRASHKASGEHTLSTARQTVTRGDTWWIATMSDKTTNEGSEALCQLQKLRQRNTWRLFRSLSTLCLSLSVLTNEYCASVNWFRSLKKISMHFFAHGLKSVERKWIHLWKRNREDAGYGNYFPWCIFLLLNKKTIDFRETVCMLF